MSNEEPNEARISALEAEVAKLQRAERIRIGLQNIELTVQRAQQIVPQVKLSSWSSACTSVCFSSASTISTEREAIIEDPAVAEVFVTLYDRAIEVLGQQGTVDAFIAVSKNETVLTLPQEGEPFIEQIKVKRQK